MNSAIDFFNRAFIFLSVQTLQPVSPRMEKSFVWLWAIKFLTSEVRMGSVIKKRRKRMSKKKHRKLLRKTRHQRRNKK
jgi:hypothetical protein